MATLTADHTAFRSTVADLRAAADRLRSDRDRAARCVDDLLGTWTGAVATSYASGWDDWCAGAARVLDGLAAMAALLEATDADLVATDGSVGDDVARLTGRLG